MAKIVRKTNIRVVVDPKRLGDFGSIRVSDNFFGNKTPEQIEKEYIKRAEEIAKQIKRHVDEVDRAEVDWDTEETCGICGYEWSIDDNGTPNCCDEAIQEYNQSKQPMNTCKE